MDEALMALLPKTTVECPRCHRSGRVSAQPGSDDLYIVTWEPGPESKAWAGRDEDRDTCVNAGALRFGDFGCGYDIPRGMAGETSHDMGC